MCVCSVVGLVEFVKNNVKAIDHAIFLMSMLMLMRLLLKKLKSLISFPLVDDMGIYNSRNSSEPKKEPFGSLIV